MTDKMIDWTKKHRVLSIVLGFISPLIIVHILFFIPAPFSFLASQWEAGDIIAYCAGFMTCSGTVFLGITANKQNAKLMEWQKSESLQAKSCNISLKDGSTIGTAGNTVRTQDSVHKGFTDVRITECCIMVRNTSPVFLQSIQIRHDVHSYEVNLTLIEGEEQRVAFTVLAKAAKYQVEFTSCYGVKTYGDFFVSYGTSAEDIDLIDNNQKPHMKYYHFYGTTPPKSIK